MKYIVLLSLIFLSIFFGTAFGDNIPWQVVDQGGGIRNSNDYELLDATGQGAIGECKNTHYSLSAGYILPITTLPPGTITNLGIATITPTSITLIWTAPGDDGYEGISTAYDVRYATFTITEDNWGLAMQCSGPPTPKLAGATQTFTVTNLLPNTTYYFAIKAKDDAERWSGLSNIATGTTLLDYGIIIGTVTDQFGTPLEGVNISIKTKATESLTSYKISPPSLTNIIIYPNPFLPEAKHTKITFKNLPQETTIKIYKYPYNLILEQNLSTSTGRWEWDVKDKEGNLVPDGFYRCEIIDKTGQKITCYLLIGTKNPLPTPTLTNSEGRFLLNVPVNIKIITTDNNGYWSGTITIGNTFIIQARKLKYRIEKKITTLTEGIVTQLNLVTVSLQWPSIEHFPLNISNLWEYRGEGMIDDISWTSSVTLKVIGTSDISGVETYIMRKEQIKDGKTSIQNDYLVEIDGKLQKYAYEWVEGVPSGPYLSPPKSTGYYYIYRGKRFNSVKEIMDYVQDVVSSTIISSTIKSSATSTINICNPPWELLKFPITVGDYWISYPSDLGTFSRQVVDVETISVPAGTFTTYKIEILHPIEDITWFNWYGVIGLIKSYTKVENIEKRGMNGEYLGTFDAWDSYELTDTILIKPPDKPGTISIPTKYGDLVVEFDSDIIDKPYYVQITPVKKPPDLPTRLKYIPNLVYDINVYDINSNLINGLNKPAIIKIPYPDEPKPGDGWVDNVFPSIKEDNLKAYLFDNGKWIGLESEVKPELNIVIAKVLHFSNITLAGSITLPYDTVIVYPNPYKPNSGHPHITFIHQILTSQSTIKIYTIAGELVDTIEETDGDGQATWRPTKLASGIYIYVITSKDGGKCIGKLAILR